MEQKIEKVCELMERVIKLNEKAKGHFFNFDFSGNTKQVNFDKWEKQGDRTFNLIYSCHSYLEKPELSVSLEDIEKLIEAEEEAQKEIEQ